jgi:hypothetical protein
MTNHYETPEVVEIGKAQDVILGVKDQPSPDNAGQTPEDFISLTGFTLDEE